ncbi:MAG: hypothetical protein LBI33_14090 [Propionibacteriaceae bacterium]|nr:hypothetical protein [Propionibacteriaceae bacterium]
MTEPTAPRPLLQQAPVVPLDASGLTASCVGTALFAVATIVSLLVGGHPEWTATLATASGIGLLLIPFTWAHRYRRLRRARAAAASVED